MQGLLALKRYIQFLGRADRKEYWQFIGIMVAAYAVAIIVGKGIAYMEVGLLPPSLIFASKRGLTAALHAGHSPG